MTGHDQQSVNPRGITVINGDAVDLDDVEDYWSTLASLSISVVREAKKQGMRFPVDWLRTFKSQWDALTPQDKSAIVLMDAVNFGEWLEDKIRKLSHGQPYVRVEDD